VCATSFSPANRIEVRRHAHLHISVKSAARNAQGLAGILKGVGRQVHTAQRHRERGWANLGCQGGWFPGPDAAVEAALIYDAVQHGRM